MNKPASGIVVCSMIEADDMVVCSMRGKKRTTSTVLCAFNEKRKLRWCVFNDKGDDMVVYSMKKPRHWCVLNEKIRRD